MDFFCRNSVEKKKSSRERIASGNFAVGIVSRGAEGAALWKRDGGV